MDRDSGEPLAGHVVSTTRPVMVESRSARDLDRGDRSRADFDVLDASCPRPEGFWLLSNSTK